ncbi:MAG: hypothetical protein CVV64_20090 [Candidatus Wallbacteria bacterium HGW-Wallbacteria-1]|uniref:Uncharacterized protein n=1 Tax=Candidatus Wallbacteria bacterium HGW-Wallbacteria-1 TaxID=2013854 RepID=A0A2N1PII5_9BACT|nr:MAG: hypothetical protein CVV64_20090 [Candidatus Wallbacteria bacterium HGW-Wallbacteria-1]
MKRILAVIAFFLILLGFTVSIQSIAYARDEMADGPETPFDQFRDESDTILLGKIVQYVHQRLRDGRFRNYMHIRVIRAIKGKVSSSEVIFECNCNLRKSDLVLAFLKTDRKSPAREFFRTPPFRLNYLTMGEIREEPSPEYTAKGPHIDFDEISAGFEIVRVAETIFSDPGKQRALAEFLLENMLAPDNETTLSQLISAGEMRKPDLEDLSVCVKGGPAILMLELKSDSAREKLRLKIAEFVSK